MRGNIATWWSIWVLDPRRFSDDHGRYHPSTACPRSTNRNLDKMVMLRWCWVFPTTAAQQLRGSSNLSWGDLHQNGLSHWLTPHKFSRNSKIAMSKRTNHLQSPQDHRFPCGLDQIPDVAAIPVGQKLAAFTTFWDRKSL